MIKDFEDTIIFSDMNEFNDLSPVHEVLCDVIERVNQRITLFYRSAEAKQADILPSEMLITVTANLFANLAHHLIRSRDVGTKIRVFDTLSDELNILSRKLFIGLETYYNSDDKQVN